MYTSDKSRAQLIKKRAAMLANVFLIAFVLFVVFIRYCPCACTICYRVYRAGMSFICGSDKPADAPRQTRTAGGTSGTSDRFDILLKTERYFIDSHAFKHVNNVAYLHEEDHSHPSMSFFNIRCEELLDEVGNWMNEHGSKPALTYELCSDNIHVNAVLHC